MADTTPTVDCPECSGTGSVPRDCDDPQCGDSTWDHYCNAGADDCPRCKGAKVVPAVPGLVAAPWKERPPHG